MKRFLTLTALLLTSFAASHAADETPIAGAIRWDAYAWNDHDEGGWLQPTLGADGKPNDERIKTLGSFLRIN